MLFPPEVIADPAMADLLLHDVDRFLAGEHGNRRYLGDSYRAPDYDTRLPPSRAMEQCARYELIAAGLRLLTAVHTSALVKSCAVSSSSANYQRLTNLRPHISSR